MTTDLDFWLLHLDRDVRDAFVVTKVIQQFQFHPFNPLGPRLKASSFHTCISSYVKECKLLESLIPAGSTINSRVVSCSRH